MKAKSARSAQHRDAIKAALAAAERERKAIAVAARLREVTEKLEAARAAAGERKSLTEALAANSAEEPLVSAARREAQSIATLEARLSAAAPSVSVAYARGVKGKIKVAGRALVDGETLNPTKPVALEIEGIGVVTVAPGRSESMAEDETDLAAHRTQAKELLGRIGAASIEEAEQRLAERREIAGRLAEVSARLETLVPDGLERLERAHAALAAQSAAAPERTLEELEANAADLSETLSEAEARLAEASAQHASVREALVQMRAASRRGRARSKPTSRASAMRQHALGAATRSQRVWATPRPRSTRRCATWRLGAKRRPTRRALPC